MATRCIACIYHPKTKFRGSLWFHIPQARGKGYMNCKLMMTEFEAIPNGITLKPTVGFF